MINNYVTNLQARAYGFSSVTVTSSGTYYNLPSIPANEVEIYNQSPTAFGIVNQGLTPGVLTTSATIGTYTQCGPNAADYVTISNAVANAAVTVAFSATPSAGAVITVMPGANFTINLDSANGVQGNTNQIFISNTAAVAVNVAYFFGFSSGNVQNIIKVGASVSPSNSIALALTNRPLVVPVQANTNELWVTSVSGNNVVVPFMWKLYDNNRGIPITARGTGG